MAINIHRFRIFGAAGILMLASVGFSIAQPRLGVEFGVADDVQKGTFYSNGGEFTNGTGTGWSASLFGIIALSRDFSVGIKIGSDEEKVGKSYNDHIYAYPGGYIFPNTPTNNVTPVVLYTVNYSIFATANFFHVEPYLQYQILNSNFFAQIGFEFYGYISSSINESISYPAAMDEPQGVNYTDLFPDQTADRGDLYYSGIFSVGYNLNIGTITISPMLSYNYPFSYFVNRNPGDDPSFDSNWKIASIYGSLAFSFSP